MTFTEVRHALTEAMKTEKIGTPVSARVHVQLPDSTRELDTVLSSAQEMLSPCFAEDVFDVRARRHASQQQTTVLLKTQTGRTVFITVGFNAAKLPSLQLLVVGNHGTISLEGSEDLQVEPPGGGSSRRDWSRAIDESIRSGKAVSGF